MKRNWKTNLYFLIIFIVYFISAGLLDSYFEKKWARFELHPLIDISVGFFLCVVFGAVLGMLYLITQWSYKGKWKFDILRFIILGIPALFFSLSVWLYYLIPINTKIIFGVFITNSSLLKLVQISLGYILVTCFYKIEDFTVMEEEKYYET